MKRMLLTAATSSLLAIMAPGVAMAAHHGKRHHRAHHTRAHHARVMVFGAATPSGTTVTGTSPGSTTPTTPSTPTPAGETAGTVASFTGGVLTITLTDGSTVSGKVTEQTEIHCQPATPAGSGDDQGTEDGNTPPSPGEPTTAMRSHHDGQSGEGGDGQDGTDGSGPGSGEGQQGCTTAALVAGAVVREAELSVGSAGAVWDHVDLIQ